MLLGRANIDHFEEIDLSKMIIRTKSFPKHKKLHILRWHRFLTLSRGARLKNV